MEKMEIPPSLTDLKEFKKRFSIFTNGQLEKWKNWKNMVVIGGSVFASLMHIPSTYSRENSEIANFYHKIAYPNSDIDIYFYGLTEKQFEKKIIQFYEHLKKNVSSEVLVVKTLFTITFCTKFPNRHIQIVMGKWNNLEEILVEPDIDCTTVAFDGTRVFCTYRSFLSFNHRLNITSERNYRLRGYPEYESRLIKYSRRGFYIGDKFLNLEIHPKCYKEGISRIEEEIMIKEKGSKPRSGQTVSGLRLLAICFKNPKIGKKLSIFRPSSFKNEGLPYGPRWNSYEIKNFLEKPRTVYSRYGPIKEKSIYTVLDRNLHVPVKLRDLDEPNEPFWRYFPDWYEYYFTPLSRFDREQRKYITDFTEKQCIRINLTIDTFGIPEGEISFCEKENHYLKSIAPYLIGRYCYSNSEEYCSGEEISRMLFHVLREKFPEIEKTYDIKWMYDYPQ